MSDDGQENLVSEEDRVSSQKFNKKVKIKNFSVYSLISIQFQIKIAANFLFHAPPGEFKEVFLGKNILKKPIKNFKT